MNNVKISIAARALAMGVVAALAIVGMAGTGAAFSNSGGGSWQYYKEITVSNSGGALGDYQVLVQLSSSNFPANARSDGADVRFTDADGSDLSYWIESWDSTGKNAKIWIKVPSIPASATATIRMYYGNPSAGSSGNGDATFELFDDFNSAIIDTNKWNIMTPSRVSSGVLFDNRYTLRLDVSELSNTEVGLSSKVLFSQSMSFHAKVRDEYSEDGGFTWSHSADTFGFNDHSGNVVETYTFGDTWRGYNNKATYSTCILRSPRLRFNWIDVIAARSLGTNRFYLIEPSGTINNCNIADQMTNNNLPVVLSSLHSYNYINKIFYVDYVYVTKFNDPEPKVTLGAEQTTSTPTPTTTPTSTSTSTPTPTTGSISVSSSPSGAGISLDGSYRGTAPKTLTDVSQGSHTIELTLAGYEEWSQTISVNAGGTYYVSAQLNPLTTPTYTATITPTYIMPTPKITDAPPSISLTKQTVDLNKNGQLDEGEKLVITYGANDENGVKSIKVLLDGNLIELRNNEGTYSVTTDSLSVGSHSIVVEAIDSNGNKNSEKMEVNAARAGPSVYFQKTRYEVNEGDDVNVVLSAVNPIGNPKMDALLILKPPSSGVSTYESDCGGYSGQCTGKFEIQPGDSVRSVSVRMKADKAGEYPIDAEIYYQFDGGQRSPTRYETLTLVVKPKTSPVGAQSIPKTPGFEVILAGIGMSLALALRRR